jgi:REP element-mobilizing transposase RayT
MFQLIFKTHSQGVLYAVLYACDCKYQLTPSPMSHTYSNLFIQTVFAVKYRNAVIDKKWRAKLHGVMGNLINEAGCKTYIVNGIEDHVHCLFSLKPSISISDVMKSVKAKSSKYVNDHGLTPQRFEWQIGFGAFSYHKSLVDTVYRYIQNQEAHHQKQSFKEEYISFLDEFEIDYDSQYLFQDLV